MKTKWLLISGFVVMLIIQWAVPGKMIYTQQQLRSQGVELRFKTAPVDPNDPFRGKYVRLDFAHEVFVVDSSVVEMYVYDALGYITFETDVEGYARPVSVSNIPPSTTEEYLECRYSVTDTGRSRDSVQVWVDYPFDRFYMEESKAYEAEVLTRSAARSDSLDAEAVVRIRSGAWSLMDVLVDGVPIREVVLENRE